MELEQKPNNSMPQQVYENKKNIISIFEEVENRFDLITYKQIKNITIEEVE